MIGGLRSKLNKSCLKELEPREDSLKCIFRSDQTWIYEDNINSLIYMLTIEFEKYQFYYYGLKEKLIHAPKINQLIADDKHGVYFIVREKLYPIIDTKKINRIKEIEYWIKNRINDEDKISDELLKFYRLNNTGDNKIDFDFGPHWIMQNKRGKLIVSDAFKRKD